MTRLVVDALVAFVRVSDWFATWVESVFRGAPSPTAGVAEPVSPGERGVPPADATGGLSHDDFAEPVGEYPDLPDLSATPGRTHSIPEVIDHAIALMNWGWALSAGPHPPEMSAVQAELRDIATRFRADEPTD